LRFFISASWSKRDEVRALAGSLRAEGHEVFDFTDPECRRSPPVKPEVSETFDPQVKTYAEYLDRSDWRSTVFENQQAIRNSDAVILLLPCGNDATADWAYAAGCGKKTYVVGQPEPGDRSLNHLWADELFADESELFTHLRRCGSENR